MNQPGITVSKKTQTRKGNNNDKVEEGFIHLEPRTHDSSLAGEHIPSITYLAEDLEAAVKAVWPRRHEFRYSEVHVLLVSWEDDDLGVAKEVAELRNVFEHLYYYEVQVYRIPHAKPDKELKRRILDFLENDGEETLLILYYGGHAKKSPQSNELPIWFANRKPKSPSLPSGGIQSLMEEADSDVMLLYDCCNSAATTTSESQQSQAGVTEVIAACGYESIAPEVGEHSFTNALMQTLAAASKGVPFSVGELHNRILNRLKCWTPSVVKDENGKMMEDENGILQYERQPRRTPIYSILVESNPRRSILLAPFRESQRSLATSVPSNAQFATGQNNIPQLIGKRKRSPSPGKEIEKFSQVILSIQLRGDQLDIQAWRECIRLFPVEAQAIKIEGIYDSFSTLLLIRLPVAVWNLLPKNPAYSFVGYVTSGNRGPSEVIETRQDLPKTSKSAPIRTSIEVEEPIPQGTLKKYYEAKPKATSSEDESPPPVSKRSRWRASKLGDLSSDEDISPPPVSRKSRWRASKFGDHKILDDIRYFWFSSDEDWFSDDDEVDEIEVPLSRHVTPSSIDQPKRYEGKPGRIVGADGEETDVSTSRAQGKASPLSTLETHFPQQPAEPPPSGRPVLISPAQLKDIIERLSPSAFLLLDVRPFLQQSSSCINGALNMWMPRDLLKWPFFSTKMHQDTFSSDAEKERFAQWKSATYIIVYDASSSKLEGAVSAVNTLKKFSNEGWKGYSYILRGGFHEFSKRFPYFIHYRTEVDLGEAFSREYDA